MSETKPTHLLVQHLGPSSERSLRHPILDSTFFLIGFAKRSGIVSIFVDLPKSAIVHRCIRLATY